MPTVKLKPLVLLDIFHKLSDAEHRLPVPTLVALMAERGITAERKSIYRDIKTLVDFGYDIVSSKTGYYMNKRKYEPAEIKLLVSAIQAAIFVTPERTQLLTEKLSGELNDYCAQALLASSGIGSAKCRNDEVLLAIEVIDAAISSHHQITFQYVKRDVNRRDIIQHSGKEYRVSPYAMIWMLDRYYLVCNMEGRDNLTHFRIDRMRDVVIDVQPWRHFSEVSEYRTKFDSVDYAGKCVNMFGGEVKKVVMRCDESIASDVFDRFGIDAAIYKESDEKFLATVRVAAGGGFLSWALQYAENIEIVSPPELRQAMKDRLCRTLSVYEK